MPGVLDLYTDNDPTRVYRPAEAPPKPTTIGEQFVAGYGEGDHRRSNAERDRLEEAYRPILERINEGRPHVWWRPQDHPERAFTNPGQWRPRDVGGDGEREREEARIWDYLGSLTAEERKAIGVPDTIDAFHDQVNAREMARMAAARAVLDRGQGAAQATAGFVGGMATMVNDPWTYATLPIGGAGSSVARRIVTAGLANMAIEGIQQPELAANSAKLGEHVGAREMAINIGAAGVFGAGLQGVGEAAFAGVRGALRRAKAARGERTTPTEDAAADVVERDVEIAETSPFMPGAGTEEHFARLEAARAALDGAEPGSAPVARGVPVIDRARVIRFVMHDLEGGAAVVRYSGADGGTTKYGIAAKHNPGVDVANLTEAGAAEIAARKYWLPEYDRADPRTAAIAFDAGYISGPKVGRRILAESGGDPVKALALYRAHLDHIADTVPGKAIYKRGWRRRVNRLAQFVDRESNGGLTIDPAKVDPADLAPAQRAADDEAIDALLRSWEEGGAARAADAEDWAAWRANDAGELAQAAYPNRPVLQTEFNDGYHIELGDLRRSIGSAAEDAGRAAAREEMAALAAGMEGSGRGAGDGAIEPAPTGKRQAGDPLTDPAPTAARALPENNFRRPLTEFTPLLWREMSFDGEAWGRLTLPSEFAGRWRNEGGTDLLMFADTPSMATGQNANKGFLFEYDADPFIGAPDFAKPGSPLAWQGGAGEYRTNNVTQAMLQGALRGFLVKPGAREALSDADRAVLDLITRDLIEQGWTRRQADAGTIYRRPGEGAVGGGAAPEAGAMPQPKLADDTIGDGFSDPAGASAETQVASVLHDLKLLAEAEPGATARLGEGEARPIAEILDELDADTAAIDAARRCL